MTHFACGWVSPRQIITFQTLIRGAIRLSLWSSFPWHARCTCTNEGMRALRGPGTEFFTLSSVCLSIQSDSSLQRKHSFEIFPTLYMSWTPFPRRHVTVHRAPPSITTDIDPLDSSLQPFFTADICIALRHPDGFTLPHNLVRETLLWEMPLLFDYRSLLSSCVSWTLPPVTSSCVRLEDEGK